MPEQRITVGRVVHYYPDDSDIAHVANLAFDREVLLAGTARTEYAGPWAALTAGVYADDAMRADLQVAYPRGAGSAQHRGVPFNDAPTPGHWTWQPVQRNQRPNVGAPESAHA